jgi:hypothetical protein
MEPLVWTPHPKQAEALSRQEFEVLFGGARGPGKTEAGIVWIGEPYQEPRYHGLAVRRNYDDMVDWIGRAKILLGVLGARFVSNPAQFIFPSGAHIRVGHLKDEDAYQKYQGAEHQRVLIEELTQIPSEESYLKLISSCRSTVDGLKPQVFCTTNPGGPGHLWVKSRFVDIGQPGKPVSFVDEATGLKKWRIFIKALVEDNPTLMEKDPSYVAWLNSLPEDLRKAWREGSWDVFQVKGSYYADEMTRARGEGRICSLPIEPNLLTHTTFDLGINDQMVIWFIQLIGMEIRWIDLEVFDNKGLDYAVQLMHSKKYKFGTHYFPHDIAVKEHNGRTRIETFIQFYRSTFNEETPNIKIVPRSNPAERIQAMRILFPRYRIDQTRCAYGINAWTQYRREWDEIKQAYKDIPYHDWASHPADSGGTFAEGFVDRLPRPKVEVPKPLRRTGGWRAQTGMG